MRVLKSRTNIHFFKRLYVYYSIFSNDFMLKYTFFQTTFRVVFFDYVYLIENQHINSYFLPSRNLTIPMGFTHKQNTIFILSTTCAMLRKERHQNQRIYNPLGE